MKLSLTTAAISKLATAAVETPKITAEDGRRTLAAKTIRAAAKTKQRLNTSSA
jgi:hypothetical protein